MHNSHFKIAVCLYIYHTDLWTEFKSLIKNLSKNCDIFLSLCNDNNNINIINDIKNNNIKIKKIFFNDNYGADISPFLFQLNNIDMDNYKYIVKLHGKKSFFGTKMHVNWRSIILNSILGDKNIFDKNINTINNDESIGMIGTTGFVGSFESVNQEKIKKICSILNINYDNVKNSEFVAGSMFIVRSSIYKKYFSANIINQILNLIKGNNEHGKLSDKSRINGTYSHAMERILGYLVKQEHKSIHRLVLPKTISIDDLSLAICYNNDCYIIEDINCFGKIFHISNKKCLIEWKHIPDKNSVFQLYTIYQKENKEYYVRS